MGKGKIPNIAIHWPIYSQLHTTLKWWNKYTSDLTMPFKGFRWNTFKTYKTENWTLLIKCGIFYQLTMLQFIPSSMWPSVWNFFP